MGYASAPIAAYDALTAHLPIAQYAAQHGVWNTNVVESLIYGISQLLFHSYAALLITFDTYKSVQILNSTLFFLLTIMSFRIAQSIYAKINKYMFYTIILTMPMFVMSAGWFYTEIVSMYFCCSVALCIVTLRPIQCWENISAAAFLGGLAVFAKLTTSYVILVFALFILFYSIKYLRKSNYSIPIIEIIRKYIIAIVLFLVPAICGPLFIWYKTGCPAFFLNTFFKSPYYPLFKFIDPFQSSKLGLTPQYFFKMVFHTSRNIEMADGGIGYCLLLFPLVILSIIFYKFNRYKISTWLFMSLCMFSISCFFTYNLRYYIYIILLFHIVIITSISIIFDKIHNSRLKNTALVILVLILVSLSCTYTNHYYQFVQKVLHPNYQMVIADALPEQIFDKLQCNARVCFANHDAEKGIYNGFMTSLTWHNALYFNKLTANEWNTEDYLRQFNYVIIKKNAPFYPQVGHDFKVMLNKKTTKDWLILICIKDDYLLYKILHKTNQKDIIKDEINKLKFIRHNISLWEGHLLGQH